MAKAKAKTSKESSNEIQVFEDFTNEEVRVISNYSEKKYYQRGETVFKEGSKDNSLYVVLKGDLDVFASTKEGEKIKLSQIVTGEVFGELSFLDGKPRSATILASDDVDLLQISRDQFGLLRNNYPSIASKLILDLARVVSLRLRNADKFIVDISDLLNNSKLEEEVPAKAKKAAKAEKPAKAKKVETKKAAKAEKPAKAKKAETKKAAKAEKPAKAKKAETKKVAKAEKPAKAKKVETKKVAKAEKPAKVEKPAKAKKAKAKKSKIAYIAPKKK
ncbi:MAG: cyclic nucleotide-binding domain-containing protein [Candidatus Sericytochromatia bacterium]